MRWLHAGVCQDILRAFIAQIPVSGGTAPEPLMVACPVCGDRFFADLAPYDELFTLEQDERAALTRLKRECPHHAHQVEVVA